MGVELAQGGLLLMGLTHLVLELAHNLQYINIKTEINSLEIRATENWGEVLIGLSFCRIGMASAGPPCIV